MITRQYLWADYAREHNDNSLDFVNVGSLVRSLQSPEDRFTFIIRRNAAQFLEGDNTSFGFQLGYINDTLYVTYVEPNSSAKQEGLMRGMWIKSIQADSEDEFIATPAQSPLFIPAANTLTLKLGTSPLSTQLITKRIAKTTFDIQAIQRISTPMMEKEKIGYITISTFFGDSFIEDITNVFQELRQENVQNLIIDLRYNGGGSLSYAETLLNALHQAKSSDNEVMYRISYNEETDTEVTYYTTNPHALNPMRCYFLVTGRSASASELVIHALNVVENIDTYVIGGLTTGKDVGSFVHLLPDEQEYTHAFFPSVFRIENARGEGYSQGIPPDYTIYDNIRAPFGDSKETMYNAALHHIRNGSFPPPDENARAQELSYPSPVLLPSAIPSVLIP